jgi:uncharacterized protein (DUF1330 family)
VNQAVAYVIGNITVRNAVKWAEYRTRVPATLVAWGGELVLRADQGVVLGGQHRHTDVVVLRFPDLGSAHGWYQSGDYQALIPLREQAADVDLNVYAAQA